MTRDDVLLVAWARKCAMDGEARSIREDCRLSLSEVAAAAGTTTTSLHRWETGKVRPGTEAALRYAHTLMALIEGSG